MSSSDPEKTKELALPYETISVDRRGAVDWLTLNRPDSLNAITTQMVSELNDYFGRMFDDAEARVIVMRGAGRAFCAGLDIKEHSRREDAPFSGGADRGAANGDVASNSPACSGLLTKLRSLGHQRVDLQFGAYYIAKRSDELAAAPHVIPTAAKKSPSGDNQVPTVAAPIGALHRGHA